MPPAIPLRPVAAAPALPAHDDTVLPHWGVAHRAIHRLCRRSRTFNTVVAAAEMRFGREELLSLPQYMALCPTGQCNALCDFCSVTKNRTGIVKKQLPFDAILRFTEPVARVIRMYGLEGNGEPTLYERFDELAASLLRNGSTAYLITNGDRLTAASIDALIGNGLDAVNFSLNAATPVTHRAVMKLKDFERVLGNIRQFVRARGTATRPAVSISMVVTRDNVHEVADFIRLGEGDLGVDRVLVRPLSEIATELGAVEDVRPLVPFESEIVDMLEGVADYLRFTTRGAEIEITPENFKAVRPDVPGTIVMPPGCERRLLAPRPASWRTAPGADVRWTWNAVHVRTGERSAGRIMESVAIPVVPGAELLFECRVAALTGSLRVGIGPAAGGGPAIVASARAGETLSIPVDAGATPALVIWIESDGAVDARLEFDRMRTPSVIRSERFVLPHQGRWEIASAGVKAEWNGSRVRIQGPVTAGPYLLKSYSAWCAPGSRLSLEVGIAVSSGSVGVGVLSADQQRWLATSSFAAGFDGNASIAFDSGADDRVFVVVYGVADGLADATIDWRDALEPPPARRTDTRDADAPAIASPSALVAGDVVTESGEGAAPTVEPRRERLAARLGRAIQGDVRYYCQKPWTDLHNFTVDGRMDVCCITTGESQARYGLGNLMTQSFQDVWNGPRAREFRRTVNSDAPLPPCRRCPMAYAYQGPLFNPAGADRRLKKALAAICKPLPFGGKLYALSARVFPPLVSHTFFRGFKR